MAVVFQRVGWGTRHPLEGSAWRCVGSLVSWSMACEVWCGGAKAHKLCCSCSGEAMDELGGRKRGRQPVSQIPVSEPRQTTKRRPHYVHFSATPPQVSSCVAQAGPWG